MLPLAVTALEAMKEVPPKTWLKLGAVILVIVVAFIVIPKIFNMNKIILGIIVFVASSIVFFTWVSERNEPKFLTPLIDRLVPFFSSEVIRTKEKPKPGKY